MLPESLPISLSPPEPLYPHYHHLLKPFPWIKSTKLFHNKTLPLPGSLPWHPPPPQVWIKFPSYMAGSLGGVRSQGQIEKTRQVGHGVLFYWKSSWKEYACRIGSCSYTIIFLDPLYLRKPTWICLHYYMALLAPVVGTPVWESLSD